MLNDDLKRRVKEANNIVDIVQSAVGKLTRSGKNYKALCPFHAEKHPSFYVMPDGQFFKCHGCQKGGDVFTFVMLSERVEFPEALKILADRAGIRMEAMDPRAAEQHNKEKEWKSFLYKLNEAAAKFFREQLFTPAGKHALAYLNKRGLNDEICERFGMGYAPGGGSPLLARLTAQRAPIKAVLAAGLANESEDGRPYDFFRDRLMFPIRDMQGRAIAFGGRILGDGQPKYINTRETLLFSKTKTVYAIDLARKEIEKSRKAIIAEGYTDAMMCHQFGITNVVACLGTAITEDHIRQLRRVADELVILTDSDDAGGKASERSLSVLMTEQMPAKIVRLPGSAKDPCDFLLAEGRDAFNKGLERSTELFEFKLERVIGKHNIGTPIGVKNAALELMELISVVPDPLLKNEYRRRVSVRLNVGERDLEYEAKRTVPSASRMPDSNKVQEHEAYSTGEAPPPETDLARAERDLLQFVFHEPVWMGEATEWVDFTCLFGRHERLIGQAILSAMGEGTLPPDPSIITEDGASSIVAREVLKKLDDAPAAGVETESFAKQVCIELAGKRLDGPKFDARKKFETLLKPVNLAHLNVKLQRINGRIRAAREKGHAEDEEAAYLEAVEVRKQIARVKAV